MQDVSSSTSWSRAAFIVLTSSPKELAEAILTLYNNTQLQKSIADNAIELLNKHGRRDSVITEKYFNLYEEVLGSSGKSL